MKFFKYLSIFLICLSLTGCSNKDYNNNKALTAQYNSTQEILSSMTTSKNGKVLEYKARTLRGHFLVAEADVQQECEYSFSLNISADVGKAKLILVKPDNTIEVLKEVIAGSENKFNGNISFHCNIGLNRIKFVGSDFKGQFKLTQPSNLFDFVEFHDDLEESIEDELEHIEDTVKNQEYIPNNAANNYVKVGTNLIEKILSLLNNRIKHIFEYGINLFKLLKYKFSFI